MMPHQGMGYSPRSPMAAQHIPMGPGSNRSAGGSSVESYPPPLQRPGPNAGMGPPNASVRMVSHPNNNPHLQQQHHPGMHPGMRMQQPPPGGHPGIRRPSSSTSDMYNHQQHPQMMQPQRSASTIPFPSPSTSQGAVPPGPPVPGGVPEYDPAQVRANNLSRAEALMTQQQRLQQQQQQNPALIPSQPSPASSSSSDMPPMRGATYPYHGQQQPQMNPPPQIHRLPSQQQNGGPPQMYHPQQQQQPRPSPTQQQQHYQATQHTVRPQFHQQPRPSPNQQPANAMQNPRQYTQLQHQQYQQEQQQLLSQHQQHLLQQQQGPPHPPP